MQREVFGNIPSVWKLVFYTVLPVLILYGAVLFSQRVRNWERGAPDNRRDHRQERQAAASRTSAPASTCRRCCAIPPPASCTASSTSRFLILLAVTTVLEINHQLPESAKFLHGDVYQAYSAIGDAAGLMLLIGVMWAIVRRYVQRPYRIRIKTKPEHALILGTFLAIAVTGFGAEVWRIALEGRPDVREVVVRRLPARRR